MRSLLTAGAILALAASPAAALEPGDLVLSTPDDVFVVDTETGETEALAPGEDPGELRWGTAIAGEGGVLFLLQTSAESGRVVELFPDDRSSRVVVESSGLVEADGIAVVSGSSGAIVRVQVSCGIGFELALVLPALMALRRSRRAR